MKKRAILFFDLSRRNFLAQNGPLVDRMRPRHLDDFVGQERIAAANPQNDQFFADHLRSPVRIRNQWLKRTLENSGKWLGKIRDGVS